jgi:PPE-repeat protein
MDFGALPPEINSGRMYSGPGAGSMLVAAVAWDGLAAELYTAATDYSSVTSGLAYRWQGPASVAMAHAAAPYMAWLSATAGQAEQAAAQARAAAGGYEAAFAATVPPPVIVANRALLMSLVATNVLGQNSPAIAATEAQYEQMWAQDAAAMYGYAASSATASRLNPFTSPPVTTDPAGLAKQGVAVAQTVGSSTVIQTQEILSNGSQLISTVPQALQGLASSPLLTSLDTVLSSVSSTLSKLGPLSTLLNFAMAPLNFLDKGLGFAKAAGGPVAAAATGAMNAVSDGARAAGSALSGLVGSGGDAGVSAAAGRGLSIGALSVPQSWLSTPTVSGSALALPSISWNASPMSGPIGSATAGLPLMPLAGAPGRGGDGPAASRFELRPTVVSRTPAGG